MKTRMSPVASRIAMRIAPPLPVPSSRITRAPYSAAISRVPSVLWPSTTSNSSANGAANSSTGRTFSASLRTGNTTLIR